MAQPIAQPTLNTERNQRINTSWTTEPVPRWRANPEKLAWAVILVSFSIFAALTFLIPWSIQYTTRYATVSQQARLESTLGTLFFYPSARAEPIAITEPRFEVAEGSRIEANGDATQGTLGLFGAQGSDELLGSVQIYAGTTLEILRMRRPYFESSSEPYTVHLNLVDGQARVFTSTGGMRPVQVKISTPNGLIELEAGSYRISVTADRTDITVRAGQASLTDLEDNSMMVGRGLRAWVENGALAEQPGSTQQNLILNGDFRRPIRDTWESYVVAENVAPGNVNIIERDGRRVAHFIRNGEENVPTEVGLQQAVNKEVHVYDTLQIQLDVRLIQQSLSGAGYLSSEFPLRVEIAYTDIYGKELHWGHGFYFRDPVDPNWKVVNGDKIPPLQWYTYQSPNLITLLDETRPAQINQIRIYASGWNYQSMVSEIYLTAQ
ncbi:MAG: hypothetical protein AAF639_18010 [Chloroflexota bacterium]